MVRHVAKEMIEALNKREEEKIILSLLNQIGWKSKIQSIITRSDLEIWYEKALRGTFSHLLSKKLLNILVEEIECEFPSSNNTDFNDFMIERMYNNIKDSFWK